MLVWVRPLPVAELFKLRDPRCTLLRLRLVFHVLLRLRERVFDRWFGGIMNLDDARDRFIVGGLLLCALGDHIGGVLWISPDLYPPRAHGVSHAKAEDGRREVVSDFFLLGVEADALRDVALAGLAEDVEWHLEAHRLFVTAEARGLLAMDLVARNSTLELWWDISSALRGFRSISPCECV